MKEENTNLIESFNKAKLIITSCTTIEHLNGVQPYLDLFKIQFDDEQLNDELVQMFNEKKKEFNY
jgi:hypothetical protein